MSRYFYGQIGPRVVLSLFCSLPNMSSCIKSVPMSPPKSLTFEPDAKGCREGQACAVVGHDVGVWHHVVLQMKQRRVQPQNPGVDEKGPHRRVDAHQIQGVGDECGGLF